MFFNPFEEHSKPGCISNKLSKKHNESITAPPLPPHATNSAKKTQGGHGSAPSSSRKKLRPPLFLLLQ
jgi:hypothetical protein